MSARCKRDLTEGERQAALADERWAELRLGGVTASSAELAFVIPFMEIKGYLHKPPLTYNLWSFIQKIEMDLNLPIYDS